MHSDRDSPDNASAPADTLYQTVFDAMAEGVVVQSAGAFVVKANPAAEQILGIDAGRMYGLTSMRSALPVIREDGSPLPGTETPAVVTFNTGRPVSGFVMGVQREDGKLVWLSVNSRPLQVADDGSVHLVVTTFSDITALKTVEARARASENRLLNIIEVAPIGMAIVTPDGKFAQVNQALCELSGYTREEFCQLNFYELGHGEDPALSALRMEQLLSGQVRSIQAEGEYPRKDGIKVWVAYTVSILRDEFGDIRYFVVQLRDVSQRKAADQALQQARRQLRTLIDTLPALVVMTDRNGRCLIANQRYAESAGRPLSNIEGTYFSDLVPSAYQGSHAGMMERCLAGESIEFTIDRADGQVGGMLHMQVRYVPLFEGGAVTGVVLAITDVSELKRAQLQLTRLNKDLIAKVEEIHQLQVKLHEMAIRDALTGLYNRRFLDEQLPRELARARRIQQPLCIALGDIDHFKKLNDTHGHQAGDAVLRSLREFFAERVRESDLVCRWGGEEILIVMPDMAPDIALQRLDRLRVALADERVSYGPHLLQVTISFGIAVCEDGATVDDLISAADKALYAAKASGRNQCMLAAPGIVRTE